MSSTIRRNIGGTPDTPVDTGPDVGQGPIPVSSGWAYVVRPPMWPMVTTPGTRGGVPMTSQAPAVHVVAVVQPGIERIFFLGGRSASGTPVACTLRVETTTGTPQSVDLPAEGWYAERRPDPITSKPGQLTRLQYSTLPETHPIRLFLASVWPGGSGSGGISEGGA